MIALERETRNTELVEALAQALLKEKLQKPTFTQMSPEMPSGVVCVDASFIVRLL